MHRYLSIAVLAISCTLPAQRTWIVDITGVGDAIQPQFAIDKAKDGDTILIRPGRYQSATLTKGLRVLAEKPRSVTLSRVSVHSLKARSPVVLRGIDCESPQHCFSIKNCSGSVHLVDCGTTLRTSISVPLVLSVQIEACALVSMTGGVMYRGFGITDSTVAISDTSIEGMRAFAVYRSGRSRQAGIAAKGSRLMLSGVVCRGGHGARLLSTFWGPSPGLRAQDSNVLIAPDDACLIAAGVLPQSIAPSIHLINSRATIDPNVPLSPATIAGSKPRFEPVAGMHVAAQRGGRITATTHGASSDLAALFVGLPGRPEPFAKLGVLWIDQSGPMLLVDVAALDAQGQRAVSIPFPSTLPDGQPIAFQSLTLGSKTLQLTASAATTTSYWK